MFGMAAPYNSVTVANYFIEKAAQQGRRLTPMQIIKLAYIAHGFSLAMLRRRLLKESVEAWRYGPVVPSLYRSLKKFGSSGVDEALAPAFFGLRTEQLDPVDQQLLDAVFAKYGNLTGVQLSYLTHRRGTPWAESYSPNELGTPIDDALIRTHYATLLANSAATN
jgi:uncharacterized phage-associated protein